MIGLCSARLFLVLAAAFEVVAVLAADQYSRADFPADFVFGSGSSAYQYEGAAFEDGRTPSIWDTFSHSDRSHGASGDVTCDGYHKYKEDIKLMSEMGLEAFRFSVSWPRLIPDGRGPVNPMGLQFYNNFIDELIRHGIQPHVTLHHHDLPQALEDEYGGWISRKIVKDFTAYADVCFREFGDRVLHWTTVNEANIFALGGYDIGIIPPGRCSMPFSNACSGGNSSTEPYIVGHNILLAHSATATLYKKKYKVTQKGYIGFSIYNMWMVPYTSTKEDVIATERAIDYFIGWLINPLIFGDYPEIVKKNAGTRIPAFTENESKQVKDSIDFVGVNHYMTTFVKDNPSYLPMDNRDLLADMAIQLIYEKGDTPPDQVKFKRQFFRYRSDLLCLTLQYRLEPFVLAQFPVMPWGLYGLLEYLKQVYGNPPVYVQENGQTTRRNGTLEDSSRVEYLHAYIGSVLDAVRNGSDTKGYFVWTLCDCLELLNGFDSGFGMYYVDLNDKDLKRYEKLSGRWYTNFLKGKSTWPQEITPSRDKLSSTFLTS
ncbi:beta-glucosidase 10-like isoform X2 [Primulina huaijiensis]|uniref:beta-glucosidase 10-like isoform X2 n=1 Tax=Primulina huaijiensis TaxID=1492673 RepID=UPI003CC71390